MAIDDKVKEATPEWSRHRYSGTGIFWSLVSIWFNIQAPIEFIYFLDAIPWFFNSLYYATSNDVALGMRRNDLESMSNAIVIFDITQSIGHRIITNGVYYYTHHGLMILLCATALIVFTSWYLITTFSSEKSAD